MEVTIEPPAPCLVAGSPSNHLPGTAGKIACLAERWALQQEMFHAGDITHERVSDGQRAQYLVSIGSDDPDDESGNEADVFIAGLIDEYIAGAHSKPSETQETSAVCLTSEDTKQPGCLGGCLWCRGESDATDD
jgi:hypothetical protein